MDACGLAPGLMVASGWLVWVEAIIFEWLSGGFANETQFVNMPICKKELLFNRHSSANAATRLDRYFDV
jgi:hypothetical protein